MASVPQSLPTETAPRRVLIVDDSAVARAVMIRALEGSGRFAVAGAVPSVAAALAVLAAGTVEAMVLDIHMPGVDGLTALPGLIAAAGGQAPVLVVSSSCRDGGAATIRALTQGAADTLVKPASGHPLGGFVTALVDKLMRLTDAAPVAAGGAPARGGIAMGVGDAFDVVAIGASTGGIHALSQLLGALTPSFTLPIVLTQHLPASFMPFFAAQVSVLAGRPCEVASDRLRLRPGRIVVAPGDAHIRLVSLGDGGAAVRLSREPASSGCMPSVDPMFDTVARVFGPRALGVVLSGMGRDGCEGARRLTEAGGCVVVQDQESSVVWGMPGAIASSGGAAAVLAPDAIGRLIAARRRPA